MHVGPAASVMLSIWGVLLAVVGLIKQMTDGFLMWFTAVRAKEANAAAKAARRMGRLFGFVALAPAGAGVDDDPRIVAVLAECSGKYALLRMAGTWKSGVSTYTVTTTPGQVLGTAPPTLGTWAAGDIVWNSAYAAGQAAGWICTVAGAPGVWVAFGASTDVTFYRLSDLAQADTTKISYNTQNITVGVQFIPMALYGQTLKISAVRFYAKYSTYPRTIKVSVWDSAGTQQLTVNVVVSAEGIYTATFASPYTVPGSQWGYRFTLGLYDTSVTQQYTYLSATYPLPMLTVGFWVNLHEWRLREDCYYNYGDGMPDSTGLGNRVPADPVYQVS